MVPGQTTTNIRIMTQRRDTRDVAIIAASWPVTGVGDSHAGKNALALDRLQVGEVRGASARPCASTLQGVPPVPPARCFRRQVSDTAEPFSIFWNLPRYTYVKVGPGSLLGIV